MNKYKVLNIVRKIVVYPVCVLIFPITAIMGFFMTNWNNPDDRAFYKKMTIGMFKD